MANRILAVILLAALPHAAAEPVPPPVRVLILTGRNNHDWRRTTPKLKAILEGTGRFAVDEAVPPEGLTESNLAPYQAILSNWNSWGQGDREAEAWPEAARQAYLGFVRNGRGHVVVHAGGSSFYAGWPEYRRIALVFWDKARTGHGPPHGFAVRVDAPDHPAVRGVEPFETRDELWNRPGVAEGATVVASAFSDAKTAGGTGGWEPVVVAAPYGRGRCLAIVLGHDAAAMDAAGFQALLVRGTAWAAEGAGMDR